MKSFPYLLVCLTLTGAVAAPCVGQWLFETVDPYQYTDTSIGIDADGTPQIIYTGPPDSFGDSTADLYYRVRTAPNTWITPDAMYPVLRVIRPKIAVDAVGNAYVVYESQWAGDTSIVKFRRTGPTTWVRDAAPVKISPGNCAGYNPRVAVGTDGSIHVVVSRPVDEGGQRVIYATYAYNSGADWKTGWSVPFTRRGDAGGVAVDVNNDAHVVMKNGDYPAYVRLHSGAVTVGPIDIDTQYSRIANPQVACEGTTAYLIACVVSGFRGSVRADSWVWSINGTDVSEPVNVSNLTQTDANPPWICANSGRVRFFWRTGELADARFAYFVSCPGRPNERVQPGYTQPQMEAVMNPAGCIYASMSDWYGAGYIGYAYRPNDSTDITPPSPVSSVTATPVGDTIRVSWRTPGDADLMGTKIACRTDRYATSPDDAQLVLGQVNYANTDSSCTLRGLSVGSTYYFSLFAWDTNGNLSAPCQASAMVTSDGAGVAKARHDGTLVTLSDVVVTAKGSTFFYVEDADRASGIKVLSNYAGSVGDVMKVTGTLTTVVLSGSPAERAISAPTVTPTGANSPLAPLALPNRSVGGGPLNTYTPGVKDGEGLNTVGLLVRTWGRVTYAGYKHFCIDDGSRIAAYGGNTGIRVLSDAVVAVGDYVMVAGINQGSVPVGWTENQRLIWCRDLSDVRKL